jgi:hypothetical protein
MLTKLFPRGGINFGRRVGFKRGQNMAVNVERHPGRAVPQPISNDFRMDALSQAFR